MKTTITIAVTAASLVFSAIGDENSKTRTRPLRSIPFVPTRHDTVKDLLWLADVGTNDVVCDLGSGDGRVVISAVRDFHARRGVGIEIDEKLVQESRSNAVAAGVEDRAVFIHGDLFTNDFSAASVVVLYLGRGANLDLRAKIVGSLRPGSRVVSHQFGMGEWVKDKRLDVRTPLLGMYGEMWNEFRTNPDVPDFDDSPSRASHDELSTWIVPAPVAGVWRGKVGAGSGEGELKLVLHQRLSGLSGSFELQGQTNLTGSITADLWGDHLRCWCRSAWGWSDQMWLDACVRGDSMSGGLWLSSGTNTVAVEWLAHRDKGNCTGTWEWPGASNAPVQLRIERRQGQLAATYTDKNREKTRWRDDAQPIPVPDIYDFGGGFYFTLLLGLEGTSLSRGARRLGPQDGWVVGEAVMDGDALKGTLAFYPHSDRFTGGDRFQKERRTGGWRDWQPTRVEH